jgi:ubiquinone/menaquinone biosynthesis C-methylase UbiE
MLTTASVMVWGSRVGKLRLRDRVLDGLALRGDETVLDVGCGHGLLLIGAAKRVPRGRAVGIDLWQTEDQAGNSPDATRANARAEEVLDRIELKTGDARQLPFGDAMFDAVVSSWALHNIYDRDGRRKALLEIVRVLKPGGCVAILDIRHTAEYAEVFRQAGFVEVSRSRPCFTFFIPTFAVHARKPK